MVACIHAVSCIFSFLKISVLFIVSLCFSEYNSFSNWRERSEWMKFGVVFSGISGLIRSRTNYNHVMHAFSFQLKKIKKQPSI